MGDELKQAYNIAKRDLRACYYSGGIVAGTHHYKDYWTRDAAFGFFGALCLEDYEIVEKHLAMLARMQRNDGMIPFLIRNYLPGLTFFQVNIKIKNKPHFKSHKALGFTDVIDSNPYFVIVLCRMILEDKSLVKRYGKNVESALDWCLAKLKDGLASEGPIAGWNDGTYKSGKVLITNVLFYKAFSDWKRICLKYKIRYKEIYDVADKIRDLLHKDFFNGEYFIDWIDRRKHSYFDSNANFLALLWGVADKWQQKSIVEYAKENVVDKPLVRLSFPNYPMKRAEIFNRLAGMADYTHKLIWVEPAIMYAQCLNKIGKKKEAKEFILELAKHIVKYDGVFEVYEPNKKPVKRFNYRSEQPYARGSGLFILACNEITKIGVSASWES